MTGCFLSTKHAGRYAVTSPITADISFLFHHTSFAHFPLFGVAIFSLPKTMVKSTPK